MENKIRYNNGLGRPCLENPLHKLVTNTNPATKAWADSVGHAKIRDLIAKAMEDDIYGLLNNAETCPKVQSGEQQ